jgi:hypothetical protein
MAALGHVTLAQAENTPARPIADAVLIVIRLVLAGRFARALRRRGSRVRSGEQRTLSAESLQAISLRLKLDATNSGMLASTALVRLNLRLISSSQ